MEDDGLSKAILAKFDTGELELRSDERAVKEPLETVTPQLVEESVASLTKAGL